MHANARTRLFSAISGSVRQSDSPRNKQRGVGALGTFWNPEFGILNYVHKIKHSQKERYMNENSNDLFDFHF